MMNGVMELDNLILSMCFHKCPIEDRAILLDAVTLATWDDRKRYENTINNEDTCTFCGAPEGSFPHLVRVCPRFEAERKASPTADIIEMLPDVITYGVPPALLAEPDGPWRPETGDKHNETPLRGPNPSFLSDADG